MDWRRVVTFALAVAAVTIAFLDLRQLRRSEWLANADATASPPAAGVRTSRSVGRDASAPASVQSPNRPATAQRTPAGPGTSAASSDQHPAATNASSYGVAADAGGSANGSAPADARGSIASAFAEWFQRVALGHGRDPAIVRDSTDSISAPGGARGRSGSPGGSTSLDLRSRVRNATQRSARGASRRTNAQ